VFNAIYSSLDLDRILVYFEIPKFGNIFHFHKESSIP